MPSKFASTLTLLVALAGPALALGVLLTSCSSEPKATDPDKTAEVVSDQKTVDVAADSAGATATDSTKMQ